MISPQQTFFQQFSKEHGSYVRRPTDGLLIFEDGATMEHRDGYVGVSQGPPNEPYLRALRIAEFHKIRFEAAIKEFNTYKDQLHQRYLVAKKTPQLASLPDRTEVEAQLKKLRGVVQRLKKEHDAAQATLDNSRPFWQQHRAEMNARTVASAEEFRALVDSIRI